MLKWILVLIAIWLVARWTGVLRMLGYGERGGARLGRSRRRDPGPRRPPGPPRRPDRMADLTQQEITDAEFEEIP